MSTRLIPDAITNAQREASDPTASAFVSANAGAGKTHVLVQRVIRLMLAGVRPEKILCITFTKAAAANMARRLFDTLGQWISLDDDALDAEIRKVGAGSPNALTRSRARRLFADALETPGGLKVQTIHALCTRLLQQFPFEANVAARFSVLDERDQTELMERAITAVLIAAANEPEGALGQALAAATANASDMTFREVVDQACAKRDTFLAWLAAEKSLPAATASLSAALGIAPTRTLADIESDIVNGPHCPSSSWTEIASALGTGKARDIDQAKRLHEALALSGAARADRYLDVFFVKRDTSPSPRKDLMTKDLAKAHPTLADSLDREKARLEILHDELCAVRTRDRTAALLAITDAVYAHYRNEKERRGLLDYDDLIDKTLDLLSEVPPSWVHYKLDQGIDHVLIDEAQDTSPRQWDIVSRLVDEFAAGEGARDRVKRTIFAVGDEKQSIYSFQGAAPREFSLRRRHFQRQFEGAGLTWRNVAFNYSFRSGETVLTSVEGVFRPPNVLRSITLDADVMPPHLALPDAAPGVIDLWDLETPDERDDVTAWQIPLDAQLETSAPVKLARRIARACAQLIAGEASQAPQRPGDILILVRSRGPLFGAIIAALKRAQLPVAGSDRLTLTDHIAVTDLMALGDALLLPQDDLALAIALKSPLFGLDDDDLFALAWQREGSLREALRNKASEPRFFAAHERLTRYEVEAARLSPFGFYAWLLGGDGARARILARLGPEANDALDEFLELALAHERRESATLQRFLAWLRAADVEIKRDMELERDEIRIMTVHGAKGLEAKTVILADTTSAPSDSRRLSLVPLIAQPRPPGMPSPVVWLGSKRDDSKALAEARMFALDAEEDEHRRLLYVAMTRAAERLVIAGALGRGPAGKREGTWYELVENGLETSGMAVEIVETDEGRLRRYRKTAPLSAMQGAPVLVAPQAREAEPSWLRQAAQRERPPAFALNPSDAQGNETTVSHPESAEARERARERGTLTHRLLQSLPALPVEARAEAARRFLARHAPDWSGAERSAVEARLIDLMSDPQLAAVFGPGSRAEVPVVGRLARDRAPDAIVSGQIDRLVVTPTDILIVDFKTNRAPAGTPESAPAQYVAQLALYRAILAQIYPDRPVRAALVWTQMAGFMEISATVLDEALMRIRSV